MIIVQKPNHVEDFEDDWVKIDYNVDSKEVEDIIKQQNEEKENEEKEIEKNKEREIKTEIKIIKKEEISSLTSDTKKLKTRKIKVIDNNIKKDKKEEVVAPWLYNAEDREEVEKKQSGRICCKACNTFFSKEKHIISKKFRGKTGPAYLYSHCRNVRIGKAEDRMLLSGLHTVADISCETCDNYVGWTYLAVEDEALKFKEGTYILENSVLSFR